MANLLNSVIANQSINPQPREEMPAFTFNTNGRIKPMKDKGRLLPSRIIGSPVEYAKDLKKDIVSIGKAAKGEANDHELGRINDLAMKLGSLGLAAYLFTKNPVNLKKTMEFVGFGTFFASMALWPKLSIQAPLKARTGVDIHQRYIDSQGRKKMLYQDPQYVLTDLYSREDLDKIGKKLNVNENLPDRDNFIKQRAQKTALQGNTLWMMTAGIASPVMSALACNALEKPITAVLEKADLASTAKALESGNAGFVAQFKQKMADKAFEKFLQENSDKVMDGKLIEELASRLGKGINSTEVTAAIKEELAALKPSTDININLEFVKAALKGRVPESALESLTEGNITAAKGSLQGIADTVAKLSGNAKPQKLSKELYNALKKAKDSKSKPTVSQVRKKIEELHSGLSEFAGKKSILDKFIAARVGDKPNTYIANQWGRVCGKLFKLMKFNMKELKALSNGDMSAFETKLTKLAQEGNTEEYNKVVKALMDLIGDYEMKTGQGFADTVQTKSGEICSAARGTLEASGFEKLASKISSTVEPKGTLQNQINTHTAERVNGARSSFYRLIQLLDLRKQGSDSDISKKIKDVLYNATPADYAEKLTTKGLNTTTSEYKSVMGALFGEQSGEAIKNSLGAVENGSKAAEALKGLEIYKQQAKNKIANWKSEITPDLSRRILDGEAASNAAERSALTGDSVKSLISKTAKQVYNSKKWLHIFGGTMIALTAATLIAGLVIGRKGKTEKQAEEESRRNG